MTWLEPDWAEQRRLLDRASDVVVEHGRTIESRPVTGHLDLAAITRRLSELDVESPNDADAVIDWAAELLTEGMVHTTHPRYFGLFNPSPSFMGIVGDLLTAGFNPQLAAWSHAPVAAEIERWTVEYLARRCGLTGDVGGSFTSGGAEANATALHLALTAKISDFGEVGLGQLGVSPVLYASAESHLAWLKIAHVTGIGRDAVRLVPVDAAHRMDVQALQGLIEQDRAAGKVPVLVVGTAGTTSAGIIDPLVDLAAVARDHSCLFHVDAAWGGAAVLSDALRRHVDGIELADTITIDPHKWMSVPMGTGILLTHRPELLAGTYRVDTHYMPDRVGDTVDPYTTTNQWSRRFAGLKLFLTLATVGRSGYADQLEHDTRLGDHLRRRLAAEGWDIVNDTPLPLVCFASPDAPGDAGYHQRIAAHIVAGGDAWLSFTVVNGKPCLRACITSHRTTEEDVDRLVDLIASARSDVELSATAP